MMMLTESICTVDTKVSTRPTVMQRTLAQLKKPANAKVQGE